ncbi:MAG: hypothetical protein MI923_22225 [Phycisphaerales bacterium]|nr:hypothetical protein [Phycisphaerales bacterium]
MSNEARVIQLTYASGPKRLPKLLRMSLLIVGGMAVCALLVPSFGWFVRSFNDWRSFKNGEVLARQDLKKGWMDQASLQDQWAKQKLLNPKLDFRLAALSRRYDRISNRKLSGYIEEMRSKTGAKLPDQAFAIAYLYCRGREAAGRNWDKHSVRILPLLRGHAPDMHVLCNDSSVRSSTTRDPVRFGYQDGIRSRIADGRLGDTLDYVYVKYATLLIDEPLFSLTEESFSHHQKWCRRDNRQSKILTVGPERAVLKLTDKVSLKVVKGSASRFDLIGVQGAEPPIELGLNLPQPPSRVIYYHCSRLVLWEYETWPDADPLFIGWHVESGLRYALQGAP